MSTTSLFALAVAASLLGGCAKLTHSDEIRVKKDSPAKAEDEAGAAAQPAMPGAVAPTPEKPQRMPAAVPQQLPAAPQGACGG
jgi:hypothetical protein